MPDSASSTKTIAHFICAALYRTLFDTLPCFHWLHLGCVVGRQKKYSNVVRNYECIQFLVCATVVNKQCNFPSVVFSNVCIKPLQPRIEKLLFYPCFLVCMIIRVHFVTHFLFKGPRLVGISDDCLFKFFRAATIGAYQN